MPEHDCLPPDVSASDFIVHLARMSGLPRTAARERAADVLRHVGLAEERYRPMGGYSTGMKQRAKLAQALAHDPRLVMLDEPTNGLDPAARDDMLRLVSRIGQRLRHRRPRHLPPARGARAGQRPRCRPRRRAGCSAPRPPTTSSDTTGTLLVEVIGERCPDAGWVRRSPPPACSASPRGTMIAIEPRRRPEAPTVHDLVRDTACRARARPDAASSPTTAASRTSSRVGGAGGRRPCRRPGRHRPASDRRRPCRSSRLSRAAASSTTSATAPTAAPASGRAPSPVALFVTGLRNAFGLGRSGKSKLLPFVLLALNLLPALIIVGVMVLTGLGQLPLSYAATPDRPRSCWRLRRRPGADPVLPRPAARLDRALPRPPAAASTYALVRLASLCGGAAALPGRPDPASLRRRAALRAADV